MSRVKALPDLDKRRSLSSKSVLQTRVLRLQYGSPSSSWRGESFNNSLSTRRALLLARASRVVIRWGERAPEVLWRCCLRVWGALAHSVILLCCLFASCGYFYAGLCIKIVNSRPFLRFWRPVFSCILNFTRNITWHLGFFFVVRQRKVISFYRTCVLP